MEKLVYDFETNYEYWRNHHEETNPRLSKVSCNIDIVRKWINWVSELPRFEDTSLNEFYLLLTDVEAQQFKNSLSELQDPIYMMSLDFDICISPHLNEVVRYMEQPESVKALTQLQPFFKKQNV